MLSGVMLSALFSGQCEHQCYDIGFACRDEAVEGAVFSITAPSMRLWWEILSDKKCQEKLLLL